MHWQKLPLANFSGPTVCLQSSMVSLDWIHRQGPVLLIALNNFDSSNTFNNDFSLTLSSGLLKCTKAQGSTWQSAVIWTYLLPPARQPSVTGPSFQKSANTIGFSFLIFVVLCHMYLRCSGVSMISKFGSRLSAYT